MKSTNRKFAKENRLFRKACEIAHINPTDRQAGKFRKHRGLAYKNQGKAQSAIDKKKQENNGARI